MAESDQGDELDEILNVIEKMLNVIEEYKNGRRNSS